MLTAGLALAAFVFALLAFVMATGTLVYVLARRFSTHEVRFADNSKAQTLVEWVPPATEANPEPTPVSMPVDRYEREQRLADAEAEIPDYDF